MTLASGEQDLSTELGQQQLRAPTLPVASKEKSFIYPDSLHGVRAARAAVMNQEVTEHRAALTSPRAGPLSFC